jgi:hypothetical protein
MSRSIIRETVAFCSFIAGATDTKARCVQMKFGILTFGYNNFSWFEDHLRRFGHYTINLGDNAQSIAIRHVYRTLGIPDDETVLINRDALPSYDGERAILIMNGVFLNWSFPLPPSIHPIFVGFHTPENVIQQNVETFKRHEPIGCRDSATTELMRSHGVQAFTTGCLTLTLPPRAESPPAPKMFVVYGANGGGFPSQVLKHIPAHLSDSAEFISGQSGEDMRDKRLKC